MPTQRKSTDKCLLCEHNQAAKKNSHILPRFLSTGFLGQKGGKRRGFSLNNDVPVSLNEKGEIESKPQVIQDAPKEDYILCNECESYFSILETSCAQFYNDWRKEEQRGNLNKVAEFFGFRILSGFTTNPSLNRLLVYSLFWRASNSSHHLFEHYELNEGLELELRLILASYKGATKQEIIEKIDAAPIPTFPYCMMTADSFKDETGNIVAAIKAENPASLHVDKFAFNLFEKISDLTNPITQISGNKYDNDLYLTVVPENFWHEVIVSPALSMMAENVRMKLRR